MDFKTILLIQKVLVASGPLLKVRRKLLSLTTGSSTDQGTITDDHGQQKLRRRVDKGLNNLTMLRQAIQFDCADKQVLEFGTGTHGVDLLLFYVCGAHRIITVDVHCGLDGQDMIQVLPFIRERFPLMAETLGLDVIQMEQQLERLAGLSSLDEILSAMNVTFISFADFASRCPASNAVDLFYSESNLQRIPKRLLKNMFSSVKESLAEKVTGFHRVDVRDINIQHLSRLHDPDLWRLEYLKFSDFIWHLITTERFGSQNRLRVCEFLDLFKYLGMSPVYQELYTYAGDVERIKSFHIDRQWDHLSAEDVAVSHARLILTRFPNTTAKASIQKFVVEREGVFYPPPVWNASQGLLEGEGIDD